MTTPGRLLDFFTLEAGEYLTRLESLATRQNIQPADATQFAAAARGLRGSATMAKASGLARLATSVERIASGVVQGAISWEPELQRSLVGSIEDLKLLVRSVRQWGAEQDARVEESLGRLARYAPARAERSEEVILPISQLFYNDDGPHVVFVAANPKTHYVGYDLFARYVIARVQGLWAGAILPVGREVIADYRYVSSLNNLVTKNYNVLPGAGGSGLIRQFAAAGPVFFGGIPQACRADTVFVVDAIVDADGKVWYLEMNCNSQQHPDIYDRMLDDIYAAKTEGAELRN